MITCTHISGIQSEEKIKEFIIDWDFFLGHYQEFVPEKLVGMSTNDCPFLGVIGNNGRKVLKINLLHDSVYGKYNKRKIG